VRKSIAIFVLGLAGTAAVLFAVYRHYPNAEHTVEIPVDLVGPGAAGEGLWSVPRNAVGSGSSPDNVFVFRLRLLRAERLPARLSKTTDGFVLIRCEGLGREDLLILQAGRMEHGLAVAPQSGLADERLIRLTLDAGVEAVQASDLAESIRFISPAYQDEPGFNSALMRELLKRTYKEFGEPRIELAEPPGVEIKGDRALVEATMKLSAAYHGRRNYLLGDRDSYDRVLLHLEKSASGWKVVSLKGLKPLGFDEGFMRLLGAEIGLPLTDRERQEKKAACMPCRNRMAERFKP
jgi:hypothetical protein